jgi:hypothetical protein
MDALCDCELHRGARRMKCEFVAVRIEGGLFCGSNLNTLRGPLTL